jgi:putative spermidine/putrescine transport system ATP-binding protein
MAVVSNQQSLFKAHMLEDESVALSLQNVSKKFRTDNVIEDISMEVKKGEFITLLGPSGVGKTTLLRIIAGLLSPSSGRIFVAGQNITSVPPYRRDIGMVFQSYALFPHLTVYENVAFPLRERGYSKGEIKSKVQDILELVALPNHHNYYPQQLSGGQQQRVALARVLVFNPKVVLMDEPLSALDRQLREEMQIEIKRICKARRATVVYVTHDQSEALVLSDKIAIIHQGKLEQSGSPIDVYNNPATAFIAKFMGESSTLTGELVEVDDDGSSILLSNKQYIRSTKILDTHRGGKLEIILRPERIKIVEQPESGCNVLDAVVVSSYFLGDKSRYQLDIGGQHLLINQSNGMSNGSLRPGQKVRVGWSRSAAHVFSAG